MPVNYCWIIKNRIRSTVIYYVKFATSSCVYQYNPTSYTFFLTQYYAMEACWQLTHYIVCACLCLVILSIFRVSISGTHSYSHNSYAWFRIQHKQSILILHYIKIHKRKKSQVFLIFFLDEIFLKAVLYWYTFFLNNDKSQLVS